MDSDARCANCGDLAGSGGLPVDNNGSFVAVDYEGEWAAVAACDNCREIHAAAGPHGVAVLAVYERATESLLAALLDAREALASIATSAEDARARVRYPEGRR
jgi:hypothetical protein